MKIVAIGGGEIGRPGTEIETLSIDKEIVKLSGKKNPRLLFLPQASNDSESYYEVVKGYYGDRLGCKTDVLYLIDQESSKEHFVSRKISEAEIREKVLSSDIIYVGGGTGTLKMLDLWKKLNVDKILKEAAARNIVLSGVSAGAICWFRHGHSDSLLKETGKYIQLGGLGIVPFLACPHYNRDPGRRDSLLDMMKIYDGKAIALEECTAMEIVDSKFRILNSKEGANAYLVYKEGNKVRERIIPPQKKFRDLKELYS